MLQHSLLASYDVDIVFLRRSHFSAVQVVYRLVCLLIGGGIFDAC